MPAATSVFVTVPPAKSAVIVSVLVYRRTYATAVDAARGRVVVDEDNRDAVAVRTFGRTAVDRRNR